MICTKCGAQLPDNSGFCNVCGASFQVAQQMNQGMPFQQMNQGTQYQMNGGAMQNTQNMYQSPNMQGYPQNGYQNPNIQGYPQNAYSTPQGYPMNPNMGNVKKKINPVVWIVLAVVLIASAVVAVILLVKTRIRKMQSEMRL